MGTTPTGTAFAAKALHPAGGLTSEGIPDGFSRPTAKWASTSTHVVQHPAGTGDSWDADLVFFCHPSIMGYYNTVYGAGGAQGNFFNPTLYPTNPAEGADTAAILEAYIAGQVKFMAMAERYRPLDFGVTLTPIASALTNQGTILCAQYPQSSRLMQTEAFYIDAKGKGKTADRASEPPFAVVQRPHVNAEAMQKDLARIGGVEAIQSRLSKSLKGDNAFEKEYTSLVEAWPQYYQDLTSLTMMPKVYSSNFSDGCYAPYKFTTDFKKWQSTKEVHRYASSTDMLAFELSPALLMYPFAEHGAVGYPYVLPSLSYDTVGAPTVARGDYNVIHIALRGMSPSASFKLTIRQSWELETLPGSSIAPFVSGPIEPDAAALYAYSLIVRKLADAYPERYNSWEKLVDVIDAAAQAAGVFIPGAGLVGKGAKALYHLLSGKKQIPMQVSIPNHPGNPGKEMKKLAQGVSAATKVANKALQAAAAGSNAALAARVAVEGVKAKRKRKKRAKASK